MTAQITLRRIKGSALTYEELDDNFNALLTASNAANSAIDGGSGILLALADTDSEVDAQIQLTKFVDLDGTTTAVQKNVLTTLDLDAENIATPSGVGSLAYNSASGNYQYTPPDLSAYLTSATTITSAQLPAIAITSVQTAVDQAAMLALTTQEGDVVVRTDETRSYVRNSGTTDPHDMTNFTLLQTPDSDTTYGMTISQTGSGTDAVLNDNPILKLDPSNGTDIDITLTGGANTTVTRIGDTEVSIASTDTTYSISSVVDAADSDNHTMIRLSAGGSGSGDDDVKIKSGGGVTLATDNDGQITITGLSIGTSSTTALAGDTSYIVSETDPVVGAISGIVKADGNGTISAAVAGTDYLAADADIDTLLLEVAKSSASLNTGDKSWIKVATVTIDARYQYYSAQLAVVGTGAASAFANEKVVAIRVKQQADMSNAPLVEVTTYNNSNEDYDFGHVVAVNTASETRVDIYFRADGPNSGAEIYKMAETATATVAWVTGFTANYVTSAPTNFVQGGVHEKWHSGNQAGIFGATNGIVKADGSGVLSAAVAGTDYDSPYKRFNSYASDW